jgi:hypothetical protein
VVGAGSVDEAARDGERGREVEVDLGDRAEFLGAAAELAVTVHPGVGALDDPAFTRLNRGRDASAGDLVDVTEFVEQVAGTRRVLATVGVHTGLLG